MRTTIELKPEHRSRLLAIAAQRGEKGFSNVLNEAVESYLGAQAERERKIQRVLQLQGVLTRKDAAALYKKVAALRASWR
jgi:polyhydroxyalkanoate synthesis regulator phasin